MFRFYDTTTKHISLSRDFIWLDKNYGTWKGLKTNIIKLEEDGVDDPGEFGRDDKNDEHFEIQPDVQPIIVEENPAVRAALRKLQTFIMTHQQPPLRLKAEDLEGSYLNQTQEENKKQI